MNQSRHPLAVALPAWLYEYDELEDFRTGNGWMQRIPAVPIEATATDVDHLNDLCVAALGDNPDPGKYIVEAVEVIVQQCGSHQIPHTSAVIVVTDDGEVLQ